MAASYKNNEQRAWHHTASTSVDANRESGPDYPRFDDGEYDGHWLEDPMAPRYGKRRL